MELKLHKRLLYHLLKEHRNHKSISMLEWVKNVNINIKKIIKMKNDKMKEKIVEIVGEHNPIIITDLSRKISTWANNTNNHDDNEWGFHDKIKELVEEKKIIEKGDLLYKN